MLLCSDSYERRAFLQMLSRANGGVPSTIGNGKACSDGDGGRGDAATDATAKNHLCAQARHPPACHPHRPSILNVLRGSLCAGSRGRDLGNRVRFLLIRRPTWKPLCWAAHCGQAQIYRRVLRPVLQCLRTNEKVVLTFGHDISQIVGEVLRHVRTPGVASPARKSIQRKVQFSSCTLQRR